MSEEELNAVKGTIDDYLWLDQAQLQYLQGSSHYHL